MRLAKNMIIVPTITPLELNYDIYNKELLGIVIIGTIIMFLASLI